ncbi:glycoside hydrolase family 13 protein [Salinimicrobium tongyeongense]|uniref:Glycoside hydrolase family 13 protein n=1 Tax=Salinimicrobium tongyeongense TaxID=2809707 RepID=A0ABY6NS77_9FLAO|nr:glycoside hydrolase family 13 protein [Salinimicrobium tongyeongense]UZH55398.1 glycoside hydrolase family 13 protein [Salinimicrobium tongyeongense]
MKNYIFLFLFLFGVSVHAQIEKVEPPFWWSGMNRSEIQLMFYGKNIAEYSVSTPSEMIVSNVRKTENPNYLFVTVQTEGLKPATYNIRLSKKGKKSMSYPFELKQREPGSALREGFDASDAIYLIMPDRFANANPANDSHPQLQEKGDRSNPGGRHGGDIEGIIQNLDYLEDLGVTAIWSTPLLEDDDPAYSYHTYAQSDVYKVDPRYGTNEDYRRLATEMEKRDMKLIMDYVTNHWGAEHWMIKDLPTYDWVHQFPGYKNSNYRMTTQFDPHSSKVDTQLNENGWFTSTMPDLNQSNPLVLNYLIQNAIWWIEYSGLDGFRVDTYSYNEKEGIAKWTKAVMDEYPNFNIVGEVWMHDQAQISYWQKDSPVGAIQSFNSHLPAVMDFTLHDAIMVMFNEDDQSWADGMVRAYDNFANDFLYSDIYNLLVFAGNHDTNRINEEFDGDVNKYKLAMTLILTTRGIPQLYYGDEIGMRGDKPAKGDADIRRDFPGGWAGDEQNAFTEAGRTQQQNEYHAFTKKLLNYRKNNEVLHTGRLLQYAPLENVYVYFRYNENDRVMVVINNNPEAQSLDLSRFAEGLAGAVSGKEIISGAQVSLDQNLEVSGKSSLVIELD